MKYLIDAEGDTTPTGNTLNEIDEWSRAMHRFNEANALGDTIGDLIVSTVFLGSDHGHGRTPELFETVALDEAGEGLRTVLSTWGEAQAIHALYCAAERGAIKRRTTQGDG